MPNRRTFLIYLAASVPLTCISTLAFGKHRDDDDDDHGHGHGHGHKDKHGRGNDGGHRYFRHQDYTLIQRYYRGPKDLPPGLQKKFDRTGTLPPGWQKRFQPFPPELMQRLPPPPPGYVTGYFGGQAVVINRTTRVVLDSIDIAAALSGR